MISGSDVATVVKTALISLGIIMEYGVQQWHSESKIEQQERVFG